MIRASASWCSRSVNYEFPIQVDFDIQRVGGPSAGLAFALAIIDDLTPGDLTGGTAGRGDGRDRRRRHGADGGWRGAEGDHGAHERREVDDRADRGGRGDAPQAPATCAWSACPRSTKPSRRCNRQVARRCRHRRRHRRDHDGMADTPRPLVPSRDSRLTPEAVAARDFSQVKRGYSESEVRAYLRMVADELSAVVGRERDLDQSRAVARRAPRRAQAAPERPGSDHPARRGDGTGARPSARVGHRAAHQGGGARSSCGPRSTGERTRAARLHPAGGRDEDARSRRRRPRTRQGHRRRGAHAARARAHRPE